MHPWSTARAGSLVIGFTLGALGAFIGVETLTTIPAGPSYAAVGPRAFPGLIGAGLVGVGALLSWRALRESDSAEDDHPLHDWHALFWIVGALATQIAVLSWVGWIPAATLVFVGVARAFGSRAWWRNAGIGLGLAGGTFLLFNQVLGLDLPVGQLVDLLRGR